MSNKGGIIEEDIMSEECCERMRDFLVPIYNLVLYINTSETKEIDIDMIKKLSTISDEAIEHMLDLVVAHEKRRKIQ